MIPVSTVLSIWTLVGWTGLVVILVVVVRLQGKITTMIDKMNDCLEREQIYHPREDHNKCVNREAHRMINTGKPDDTT